MAETSNVLRRLEAAGVLSRLDAATAHRDLLGLDIALFPFAPFAGRVWALRANLTSYDAWYVALAEDLDCPPGNARWAARARPRPNLPLRRPAAGI